MKRKRTNRKKWRRGTALFLASLLTLQVFTGNIAGVKALEFSSGEEQAADSGYEVSDYDQSEDTANEENYDVNEENLDTENSGNVSEEKSGNNSQEENSGSADSSTDDQNGNSADENESGNTASGSENGSENTGSATETGSSDNESTGSTTESSASDKNSPSGNETKAADESTASGTETDAADESTSAGDETNAADESTSAGSETTAAETGTTAANESSTAETSVPETKPAQQIAYYADDSTVIDMSSAASDLWLYNNVQYGYGNNDPETANGKYVISGSTGKNIYIGNGDDSDRYGSNNIEVCLNGLELSGTLTVNPIGSRITAENGENSISEYAADLTVSVQSKIEKLVLADGARMNIDLADGEAGIEIGEIKLGKGSVLTVTPGNGTVTETEAEAGEELTEEQIQIAKAAAKNDGGKFTVTGSFTGEGSVIFAGNGNEIANVIVKKGIQADILSFADVSVEANSGTTRGNLEAKNRLTVTNSAISGAGLLGYAKTTTGEKTITFDGSNSLTNVSSVGTTADGEAIITIEGIDTFSALSADVAFYQDYELTYSFENEDKTEGTPGTDWPVYYRTKLTNLTPGQDAKGTVIGSHTRTVGSTDAADEAAEDESPEYAYHYASAGSNGVTLPVFSVTGYQYAGWTLSDADEENSEPEPVKALSGEHSGALTLTLALKSDPVKVTFDRGYDPDENTNDDYKTLSRTETYDKELGDIIELGEQPYRFGYNFDGWKVTTGTKTTVLASDETTYTVKLDDTETTDTKSTSFLSGLIRMLEGEVANQRVVNFEAMWSPKEYDLRLFMNSSVAPENIQVIEEGNTYTLEAYAEKYPNVNYTSGETQISFAQKIEYGESLDHYLTKKVEIPSLPVFEDKRTGELKVDFNGWQTPGNNMIGDISQLTFAVGSILDNIDRANNQTLKDYDQIIIKTPQVLTTQWGTASYTLTTDIVSGWDILVDGVKQSQSVFSRVRNALTKSNTMSVKVKTGSTVSWRCSATSPENFSLWNFSTNPEEVGFAPKETDYSSSAQYLYFNAEMPAANVTAVNSSDLSNLYIDINQSPITFEENVTLKSGRTTNGFWYGLSMEGTEYNASDNTTLNVNAMSPLFQAESSDSTHPGEYFYEWRFKDSFRITSQKNSTTNPLTVVNTIPLYMKDCILEANQEYKDEVQGRKVDSYVVEAVSAGTIEKDIKSLKKYGNIIQDVSEHEKYNVDITVLGSENSLGTIVQSAFFAASGYESTFYIKGQSRETTKAVLSGIFADATLRFSNITIEEDKDSNSEYLAFVNGADEHQCHVYFTNCDVKAPNKRLYTLEGSGVLRSTHMDIGSARTYGTTTLYEDSYLHCRKDWLGRYATFTINDDSSIVVEGNVLSGYPHRTAGATINTSGYYIVKGNRADLENFNLTKGTVIANAALIARSCTITGGTLITNQIMNSPVKYPFYVDKNGEYTYTNLGYVVSADKNGDDYPFLTYAANEPTAGVYEFSGNALIGILGYYQVSGNSYDTTVTGMDSGNPVADFIDAAVDENGNIRSSVALPNLENAVKNSSYKTNECFVFGNSEYDTAATMRSVKIGGNAKIYAAGNVTFYNDTTITGGEIYCGGTLASKRDLSIGGSANITAKEVGNNYNLCEEDDNGFKRWEKTEITGGTIKSDRIGSLTTAHGNKSGDEYSRTTLKISGSPNITRLSESTSGAKTEYVTDTRINYVYEDPLDNPEENPDNVRHSGDDFENLTADSVTTIENPSSTDSSVSARWALDALSGPYMNQIMKNAALAYNGTAIEGAHAYKNRDYILLYAVQDNYNINVKAGAEQIESITANGTEYRDFSDPIVSGHGSDVKVTLNSTEMKDKTVIWYIDAAGQIHNVKPEIKTVSDKTELSFEMPIGNADIYVTNEITLYLNKTEITLTQDGFRTKYDMDGADTDDFSFRYLGNIVVTQDNISETVLNESNGYVYAMDNNGVSGNWAYCATTNRLHIVGWYSDRNVTLEKVLMDGGLDEDKIFIEENCDVTLQINGAVRLLSTKLADGSKLTFAGKNKVKAGNSSQDAIHFYAGAAGSKYSTGFINNGTEKTGDVTFSSINIVRSYPGVGDRSRRPIVYSSSSKRGGNVLFDNCTIKTNIYDSMGIVRYYENVSLKGCDTKITTVTSYTSILFENCSYVKIDGGNFDALFSSPYRTYAPSYSTGTFEITNHANVTWREKDTTDKMVFLSDTGNNVIPATFTVKNGAVFSMDHRMKLKTLRLTADDGSDAPTVTVGQKNGDTYDGYLLCKKLEVEKGTLNTGGLLISGYYDAPSREQDYKSEAEIMAMLQSETRITSGGVMNITGGGVNASEFVGGARGGSINVSGGKLTSPAIGTLDKLYGYGQNIPAEGGKWIYSYATIPKTLTVNLSDSGAIEVQGGQNGTEGYLGGMNSVVNMTGGTLMIDDNSVVGMSESHKKTLSDYYSSQGDSILTHKPNCSVAVSGGYVKKNDDNGTGSISAPYGEVTISGSATKVDVNNLQAERGDVTITQASGKTDGFDNPYKGGELLRQETVGVKVSGLLTAENLTIKENAQVFADKAYAVVTDGNGKLSVPKGSGAGLYSNAYGELGISRADDKKDYIDESNSPDQTVFGSHMVSITYVLNPENVILSDDVKKIENPNPENYMVESDPIDLQDAECRGYYFRGWYIDPELRKPAGETINTGLSSDLTLYAKWEKIKVKFAVRIPVGDEIIKTALPNSEFDGITGWKQDGDYYISEITPSIEYGSKILGTSGVNVGLYNTKTMNVLEVEIADAGNYAGAKKIDGTTVVTADLAEAYRSISNGGENNNAVIVLTMVDNQKRRAVITFALNKKNSKPSDAAFTGTITQTMEDTLSVEDKLASSTKFADANVTDEDSKSPGLIRPSATGYTFIGWNTDKDADANDSEGWVNSENVFKTETTVYAVWKENTYLVQFNGGGESDRVWVTEGNSEPQADLQTVPSLLYYWVYDTPVSAGSFYPVKAGEENPAGATELPYAWKEGYVFDHTSGWTLADGSKKSVGRDTVLNKSVITTLDPALGDPNGKPETVALTLEASYSSVKVRYHLEGGKFKEPVDGSVMDTVENPIQTAAPTFGTALKGYTKTDTVPTGGVPTASVSATDETGTMAAYQVISTTAEHYNRDKEYVEADYRHVLSKKGYTFGGWFTRVTGTSESGEPTVQEGTQIGSTPRFQDVDVYAKWTPNSYKLDLYNKGEGEYQYTEFDTDKLESPIKQVPVTVGSEINVTDGVQWPSRNGDWYAYNKGTDAQENAKRFFLGVTFAALDPGDTRDGNDGYPTYINYAKSVTKLQNSGTLFQNRTTQSTLPVAGTIFQLPEDTTYQSAISDSYGSGAAEYKVPDYPEGSTISMYAIYRERSLVFVERYIDENGDVQETVMSSGPWNEYSTYPKNDYTPSQAIKNLGYSLVGWYVNGTTTAAPKYPDNKAAYDAAVEGYKSTAVTTGTYDIIVYTVFAPQITQNVYLNASTSSKAGQQVAANVYTLPASMELGELRVKLQSAVKDLKLVSAEEMKKHVYDSEWTDNKSVSHTADNTVAIVATLETEGTRKEIDLSAVTTENSSFELNAGAGSKITLTMYHSGVMTGEKDYEINLELSFYQQASASDKSNRLEYQWIKENVHVKLVQSLYDVTYTVQLPESADKLTPVGQKWNAFEEPKDASAMTTAKTETVGYGADLTDALPEFEGYTAKTQWFTTADPVKGYTTLTMPVKAENDGKISLVRGYEPNLYELSADSDVLQWWNITYTDGADGNASGTLGADKADVKYHSVVTFSPKANAGDKTDPPQFVTLTMKGADGTVAKVVKLPDYGTAAADGKSYTFAMPAYAVHASRATVQTLYLDDGTISITAEGYTHYKETGTVTATWPGDYVILQCADNNKDPHSTANVLNLAGKLGERTIQLGNLDITSQDSIALAEGTKANLTVNYGDQASWIKAENILAAGSGTELKIHTGLMSGTAEDTERKADITLTPSTSRAAIGGSTGTPEIGTIEIDNLNLDLNLPAGSSASGIGAGAKTGTTGGTVSVANSVVGAAEDSATSGYSGAWIGGTIVSDVTVEHTEIKKTGTKNMGGPVITDGDKVTITDSTIGSDDTRVNDPVHAKNELTIVNSTIYQEIRDNLTKTNATAPIGTAGGMTTVSDGSQINTTNSQNGDKSDYYTGKLLINDAESDVYIWGTQIVELGNGSVEIEEKKVTQGTSNVSHVQSRAMDYLLLEEKNVTAGAPDLTITSIGSSNNVTVRNPYGTNAANGKATVKDLSVNTDAEIVLEGNLTVDGKAVLGSGKNLTVDANAVDNPEAQNPYGITLNGASTGTNAAFADGASYMQEGGKFTSVGDLGNENGSGLDVTLTNVTTNVSNLYAKNLTISGGSAEDGTNGTTGEIGSKPALGADGTAAPTTVTLKDGASVTAKTIGALGDQNKTFTFVEAKTDNDTMLKIHGNLVQDLYRLKYDTVTSDLTTDSLDTVVRTSAGMDDNSVDAAAITSASTTICPKDGVPGDPIFNGGTVSDVFTCWYIWRKPSEGETEAQRVGLAAGNAIPVGMTGVTKLTNATPDTVRAGEYYQIETDDGTHTLLVHAWLKATGTATVKEGRRFESFDGADTTVTICENHAFTAQLVSTGTAISNRDYALTFNSVLPVGTDLTLTLAGDPKSYYYYTVTDKDVTDAKKNFFFSEFKAMGSESAPAFTAGASAADETFLVAVDFADAASKTSLNNLEMQFKLLPSKDDRTSMLNLGNQLTCGFTRVQLGQLKAGEKSVQVTQTPAGDSALDGRTLYLAAKVTKQNSTSGSANSLIPYGVKATLTDGEANPTSGTWIGRDTVLFEAGTYNTVSTAERTVSFEGLDAGTYDVQWTLVYGAGSGSDLYNLLGNTLSNSAKGTYTVAAEADPYLAVTADEAGRTIAQGIEKKVGFNWKSTASAEDVKVTVEEQGLLGDFGAVSGSTADGFTIVESESSSTAGQMAAGTAAVTFGSNVKAGTYRIVFSMDENSREDNVYFVFIVEENK